MSKNESETSSLSKNWELNQYELNRIPHEIIHDDTEIAISPQILQNELLCPICLDILKKTMTTKECLHRFCHDCIITALRAGNKECPTCRKKLASKRSLRPDPNFDAIIAKIFPNREEYDAMHERVLEKLKFKKVINQNNQKVRQSRQNKLDNIENNNGAPSTPSRAVDEENAMDMETNNNNKAKGSSKTKPVYNFSNRPPQIDQNSDADSDTESLASTEQSSLHTADNNHDEVEIVLKPHPLKEFNSSLKRFIKTTSNATVTHLSKYLWTRLTVDNVSQVSSPSSASSSTKSSHLIQNNVSNIGNIPNLPTSSAAASNNSDSSISDFQIYYSSNETKLNCFHLLNQDSTLEQVIAEYWKQNRPLELYYFNQKQTGGSNSTVILKNEENSSVNNNNHENTNNNNTNGISSSISSGSSTSSSSTISNSNKNSNT